VRRFGAHRRTRGWRRHRAAARGLPRYAVGMCNDYEQHVSWAQYKKALESVAIKVPPRQSELDLPRADDIHINDMAPIMRAADDDVVELAPMRFGFPPPRPKASPVFNFRSEGRHFDQSQRCLVPASAFFEFTGTKYPKTKHRFALRGSPMLAIAGVWREGHGNQPPTFTMLTTDPGPDVKPYHNRQVVVLPPEDWAAWLKLSKPEAELLRPLPEGALSVETVRPASARST
jgi:putative SOS response-associated peptidase YedK